MAELGGSGRSLPGEEAVGGFRAAYRWASASTVSKGLFDFRGSSTLGGHRWVRARVATVHRVAVQQQPAHRAGTSRPGCAGAGQRRHRPAAHHPAQDRAAPGGGAGVVGEYDPTGDAEPDFTCAAYVFAFWRLCQQHTSTDRGLGGEGSTVASVGDRADRQRALDQVRVINLRRRGSIAGAGAGHRGLQHRFPVRMHKVRQYYPSLDAQGHLAGPVHQRPRRRAPAHRRQSPRHPIAATQPARSSPAPSCIDGG